MNPEKFKTMSVVERLKVLGDMDKLRENHRKQDALLVELHRTLMHEWHGREIMAHQRDEQVTINWTPDTYLKLLRAYLRAVEEGKDQFTLTLPTPHEFVTGYAKYLLEYLEGEFERTGLWDHGEKMRASIIKSDHKKRMKAKEGTP